VLIWGSIRGNDEVIEAQIQRDELRKLLKLAGIDPINRLLRKKSSSQRGFHHGIRFWRGIGGADSLPGALEGELVAGDVQARWSHK
jgi:hypothetical protein